MCAWIFLALCVQVYMWNSVSWRELRGLLAAVMAWLHALLNHVYIVQISQILSIFIAFFQMIVGLYFHLSTSKYRWLLWDQQYRFVSLTKISKTTWKTSIKANTKTQSVRERNCRKIPSQIFKSLPAFIAKEHRNQIVLTKLRKNIVHHKHYNFGREEGFSV